MSFCFFFWKRIRMSKIAKFDSLGLTTQHGDVRDIVRPERPSTSVMPGRQLPEELLQSTDQTGSKLHIWGFSLFSSEGRTTLPIARSSSHLIFAPKVKALVTDDIFLLYLRLLLNRGIVRHRFPNDESICHPSI